MDNDLYREQIAEGRSRERDMDKLNNDITKGFHSSHQGTVGICRTCDQIEEEAKGFEQLLLWPKWADINEDAVCGVYDDLLGVNCPLVEGHEGEHRGLFQSGINVSWQVYPGHYDDPLEFMPDETPGERGSEKFHALLDEIGDLHDRKQKDYGSDADPFANVRASQEFGVAPWVGALIRLNDKVTRLKSFAVKGVLSNESAEDSMLDIAVYALISLILYREEEDASGD